MSIRIIIGQRGWTWIGRVQTSGDSVVVTDAWCIRRWGTSKGLGELAQGPVPGTVLDYVGTIRLSPLNIVATYDVDQDVWEQCLARIA